MSSRLRYPHLHDEQEAKKAAREQERLQKLAEKKAKDDEIAQRTVCISLGLIGCQLTSLQLEEQRKKEKASSMFRNFFSQVSFILVINNLPSYPSPH